MFFTKDLLGPKTEMDGFTSTKWETMRAKVAMNEELIKNQKVLLKQNDQDEMLRNRTEIY